MYHFVAETFLLVSALAMGLSPYFLVFYLLVKPFHFLVILPKKLKLIFNEQTFDAIVELRLSSWLCIPIKNLRDMAISDARIKLYMIQTKTSRPCYFLLEDKLQRKLKFKIDETEAYELEDMLSTVFPNFQTNFSINAKRNLS